MSEDYDEWSELEDEKRAPQIIIVQHFPKSSCRHRGAGA